MPHVWANSLTAIVEGAMCGRKQTKAEQVTDLEAYASLMADLSEIE